MTTTTKLNDSPPRVSVVMPVYNVEAYIAEAIESVLAQSFTDWELLIIDDGGSDRSIDIAAEYCDPRIRIIAQRNRGLAGARNTGIAHARGDYIALLDSDDRWLPEKLALHIIHLDAAPDVDVSYSASRFIDGEGHVLRQAQTPQLHNITPQLILCRNPVGNGSAPVLRRSTLDRVAFTHPDEAGRTCWFDESFRQSEDIEMWVRLAIQAQAVFDGIAPELTEYRIVSGGLSANIARQFESWERMVAKTRSYAPDFIRKHGNRARAYQLRYLARRSVQLGDGSFALSLVGQAMKASIRPLIEEPRKTVVTFVAALVARSVDADRFNRIAGRWMGGKAAA